MDFENIKKCVHTLVGKKGSSFLVSSIRDKERELCLNSKDGLYSFHITCPSKESPGWAVWSDSDISRSVVQDLMDKLDFDEVRDISEIVEAIQDAVNKRTTIDSFKDENGDDHDDDDDDDDGYDDEEEEDDNYYAEVDADAENDDGSVSNVGREEEEHELASNFFQGSGTPAAVSRLIKDLKVIKSESHKFGIVGSPSGDNLFVWDVKLINIPTDTKLGKDLLQYGRKYKQEAAIVLSVQFPPDYPFSPPFLRVIKPRFKFLTGHVTIGGSICMQMLTKSGWCPTNDIESLLVQVRTEILSDPKASLDPRRPDQAYSEAEARDAFERMVKKYGWS